MIKGLVFLVMAVEVVTSCYWFSFCTDKVWSISGTVKTDNYKQTIDLVSQLEGLEELNPDQLVYKTIELTGKGTEVYYDLDFKTKPLLPEDLIVKPKHEVDVDSWHFLGGSGFAALGLIILLVLYCASDKETP